MSAYDSLFASKEVMPLDVTLPGDQKIQLWYRELPAVAFLRFHDISSKGDEMTRANAYAKLISESLVDPDGAKAMSFEKALTLKAGALEAIFVALLDAHGRGPNSSNEGEGSPSEGSDGSGTS